MELDALDELHAFVIDLGYRRITVAVLVDGMDYAVTSNGLYTSS